MNNYTRICARVDLDAIEYNMEMMKKGGEHLTRSKPAPDIFLLAAQKLGTEPAKTMVLEDSYNGCLLYTSRCV